MRSIIECLESRLFLTGTASIALGTYVLQPNKPNQTIDILASGTALVPGMDFALTIQSGAQIPGVPLGPAITNVDIVGAGTLFNGNNTGQAPSSPTQQGQFFSTHTTTGSGTIAVGNNAVIAVVTLDTTGINSGSFSISAAGKYQGTFVTDRTDFADPTVITFTDGTLNIAGTKTASTTTLVSSANPSNVGAGVTFTATVVGTGSTPSGTVTFFNGLTPLGGAVTVVNGVAQLMTSSLPTGTDSITADYSGDSNYNSSNSAALSQGVIISPTTTTLMSSVNPAVPGASVTFTATVSGSGIPSGSVTFFNGVTQLGAPVTLVGGVAQLSTSSLPLGTDSITAKYGGDSNNAASTSTMLSQSIAVLPTTTTLQSSANPQVPGASVTFTATVTSAGAPTGSVTFFIGAAPLGAPVTLTGGVAQLSTSALPLGTDSITAKYNGDIDNAVSTSAMLSQSIALLATTTTLQSSVNPQVPGASVTFTATVTGAGAPAGTVTFFNGATALGAPVTLTGGVAMFSTSSLPLGSDSITATYNGNTTNAASTSSALSQSIARRASTTTLVSSANPVLPGTAVTFTATVSSAGSPTGTVTFFNGATQLGAPVALTGGVAMLTTSTLPTGTDSITATYNGDTTNATSTSAIFRQTLAGTQPTSTSVVASANSSNAGQSITFTATVTGPGPFTGTVSFFNGTTQLGDPVAVTNGVAVLTTSALPAGTNSVTANYNGDAVNAAGTSPVISQTVIIQPTTTTLVSSANPVLPGTPITFTATVSGLVSPSGTVTFFDGATQLGSPVTLAGGVASFETSSLPVGPNIITADYNGDAFNATSVSSPLTQSVAGSGVTTTSLVSSRNPAPLGAPITFTATVSGSGSPTGRVTFFDGLSQLGGAVPLTGGIAVLSISSLPVGTDIITADYSGDITNAASASPGLSESITSNVSTTPPNLVPSLTGKVPASIIATTPLKLTEKLTFTAEHSAVSGTAHAQVLISPDVDAADSVLTLSTLTAKLKLKATKARSFNLKLPKSIPASVAAGSYHVLIQFTDTTGVVNTIDSGQTLNIVAPIVDITGSFVKAPVSVKAGKKFTATFLISNSSAANVAAVGLLPIEVETSPDGLLSDAVPAPTSLRRINVKPGKSIRITITETISSAAYLVVQLDPAHTVFSNDVNPSNNSFATVSQILVE